MPQSCVAFGCTNRGKIDGLTYHRFPTDEELRRQWVIAVNRNEWTPTEYSRLCSAHFREADLDRTLVRLRLREGAVPSIFPACSNVKDSHGLKTKQGHDDTETVKPQSVETPKEKKLKAELFKSQSTVKKQNRKIKLLQQSKRRLSKRVANLEFIIESLRNKMNIQDNTESTSIRELFPDHLFVRLFDK